MPIEKMNLVKGQTSSVSIDGVCVCVIILRVPACLMPDLTERNRVLLSELDVCYEYAKTKIK